MKALMKDIPAEWLVDSELFPHKLCIRLQFDEDHLYYAIIDFEEVVDAVMWRKKNEPDKKNWKHNIPLRHETYWVIEQIKEDKINICKMPAFELAVFAATCTAGIDDLEIE